MDISDLDLTISLSRARGRDPFEELAPRIRPLSRTCGRPSIRKRYVFRIGLSHTRGRGVVEPQIMEAQEMASLPSREGLTPG